VHAVEQLVPAPSSAVSERHSPQFDSAAIFRSSRMLTLPIPDPAQIPQLRKLEMTFHHYLEIQAE
jgi:hypothetical protein